MRAVDRVIDNFISIKFDSQFNLGGINLFE